MFLEVQVAGKILSISPNEYQLVYTNNGLAPYTKYSWRRGKVSFTVVLPEHTECPIIAWKWGLFERT